MLKLFQDFKTKLVMINFLSNIKLIDLFKLLNLKIKNPEIIKSKNFSNKKINFKQNIRKEVHSIYVPLFRFFYFILYVLLNSSK